eukprot:Gb_36187 [translate_table: standard]
MGSVGFVEFMKRHLQWRGYERLHSRGGRRLRVARFGGGNRVVWRLKRLPKLRLKSFLHASLARRFVMKLKEFYVKAMLSAAQHSRDAKQKRIDMFNEKVIIEIYKSLGIQVQVLPSDPSDRLKAIL